MLNCLNSRANEPTVRHLEKDQVALTYVPKVGDEPVKLPLNARLLELVYRAGKLGWLCVVFARAFPGGAELKITMDFIGFRSYDEDMCHRSHRMHVCLGRRYILHISRSRVTIRFDEF